MTRNLLIVSLLAGFCVSSASCDDGAPDLTREASVPAAYDRVEQWRFNQLAVRLNLPLFWARDTDQDNSIDPDEVAALLFYPTVGRWVEDGAFTQDFAIAYERIAALDKAPAVPADVPAEDRARREAVVRELDQGFAALVHSDLSAMSSEEKRFLSIMLEAGALIDKLYARTAGITTLAAQVPPDDIASQSLFRRNWGPICVFPPTADDPACSAIPGGPKPKLDVYPSTLVDDEGAFCSALEAHPDAAVLLAPFVVVRGDGDALTAVPYSQAYADDMAAIAAKLDEAALAVTDPSEAALDAYLSAAAQAFRDNGWEAADEAWARMNGQASRWYLRIGPDEVYWDPCNRKAGFHMTLARINAESVAWHQMLNPIKQEMEDSLAALAGPPYQARAATFNLPDFIDIVANYGDDRQPMGWVAGQSLPNWGPVANEGRSRTMLMTNMGPGRAPDASYRQWAETFLSKESMVHFPTDSYASQTLATILHEAAHNLGPSAEYKVGGLTDDQVFGGYGATLFEELKAESSALFYAKLLGEKGIITPQQARGMYTDRFIWLLGEISLGMYTATGSPAPYSQLSAIIVGFLMDAGAILFSAEALAANGTNLGAFTLDHDKLPGAIDSLMQTVAVIKATGDGAAAKSLANRYVEGTVVPTPFVTELFGNSVGVNIVYSLQY